MSFQQPETHRQKRLTVKRLQHVSVPRPPGAEAHRVALAFYGDVLGLQEIPKPATFAEIEVTWFQLGDSELHVYARGDREPWPHSEAHFCLEVEDPDAARSELEAAGYPCAPAA